MKKILIIFLVLFGINLVSAQLNAATDVYQFSNDTNRQNYLELTKQLRCPKCQNQDIADSNAPIAADMRREVHRMVELGSSKDEIVAFMVERFGEFVSYKPKVIPATYMLWYGPWVLVAFGLFLVFFMAKRRIAGNSIKSSDSTETNLTEQQRQQLERMVKQYSEDTKPNKENIE